MGMSFGILGILALVGAVVVLGAIAAVVVYFIMRSGGDEHE